EPLELTDVPDDGRPARVDLHPGPAEVPQAARADERGDDQAEEKGSGGAHTRDLSGGSRGSGRLRGGRGGREGADRVTVGLDRNLTRREFLVRSATLPSAWSVVQGSAASQKSATRLILLGTSGGPRPHKSSAASAQVIVSGNVAYVVDCGNGVARQFVSAGV